MAEFLIGSEIAADAFAAEAFAPELGLAAGDIGVTAADAAAATAAEGAAGGALAGAELGGAVGPAAVPGVEIAGSAAPTAFDIASQTGGAALAPGVEDVALGNVFGTGSVPMGSFPEAVAQTGIPQAVGTPIGAATSFANPAAALDPALSPVGPELQGGTLGNIPEDTFLPSQPARNFDPLSFKGSPFTETTQQIPFNEQQPLAGQQFASNVQGVSDASGMQWDTIAPEQPPGTGGGAGRFANVNMSPDIPGLSGVSSSAPLDSPTAGTNPNVNPTDFSGLGGGKEGLGGETSAFPQGQPTDFQSVNFEGNAQTQPGFFDKTFGSFGNEVPLAPQPEPAPMAQSPLDLSQIMEPGVNDPTVQWPSGDETSTPQVQFGDSWSGTTQPVAGASMGPGDIPGAVASPAAQPAVLGSLQTGPAFDQTVPSDAFGSVLPQDQPLSFANLPGIPEGATGIGGMSPMEFQPGGDTSAGTALGAVTGPGGVTGQSAGTGAGSILGMNPTTLAGLAAVAGASAFGNRQTPAQKQLGTVASNAQSQGLQDLALAEQGIITPSQQAILDTNFAQAKARLDQQFANMGIVNPQNDSSYQGAIMNLRNQIYVTQKQQFIDAAMANAQNLLKLASGDLQFLSGQQVQGDQQLALNLANSLAGLARFQAVTQPKAIG